MRIKSAITIAAASILLHCSLVLGEAPSSSNPAIAEQSQLLQGTWEGVEVGREAEGKCTLTITGDSIHFQGSQKEEWYKATFTLSPETNPMKLVATITDCPSPDVIGKPAVAIYKFENDSLTLAGHQPGADNAPLSFEGDRSSRTFVFKKAAVNK